MWKLAVSLVAAAVVFSAAGFVVWIYRLPAAVAAGVPAPLPAAEAARILHDLKPPKRPQRPLVAIVGINDATETTDYLMPYGILRRADIADVVALATEAGPMRLFPVLAVEPQATLAQFDKEHPDGADYVVVPAMSRDDDPVIAAWLKQQAANGAIIVGVCAGAKVVAAAGLLDDRRGTTHWYYVDEMRRKHPSIVYVANQRVVVDRGIVTTTGISASMPASLMLIEAMAGRAKAEAVADDLGVAQWHGGHRSDDFKLTRSFAFTVLGNAVAFWRRERPGIELTPGIDEVSLALVADAWSRTYRSHAVTYAAGARPTESRNGLRIIPDYDTAASPHDRSLLLVADRGPAKILDDTLASIGHRYGRPTAEVVATQLEFSTH